jgi:succinate dehydrogenase / fumarate reductase cytochrome b subunit
MTASESAQARQPAERPLSPHLQVYRPQISSVMSILHRITGVGLILGMVLVSCWLVCLAMGEEQYQLFLTVMQHPVAQLVLFGLTFAFFYHLCAGIRHLLWDAGYCVSNEGVNSTGKIVIGVSVLTTAGIWAKLIIFGGACPWLM